MAQKSKQLELPLEGKGEAPRAERSGQASPATTGNERPGTGSLMEKVLRRPNLMRALKRVRKNGGSPGIDGMTVGELSDWLKEHWPRVREQVLAGTYQPSPVRRAVIPKRDGGERQLGMPTVLDRLIQQALLQVLQPRFDPTFSEHSHGFRPRRGAHGAIGEARRHIQAGKKWVVDVDLEKFFDRVNHDVLMGRLAKRIEDRLVLGLTRRTRGRSLEQVASELRAYLRGWKNYFRLAETPGVFDDVDKWIRHRLRAYRLKQWKRGKTVFRELRALGAPVDLAARIAGNTHRWWRNSAMALHLVMPISYFDRLGVPRLAT